MTKCLFLLSLCLLFFVAFSSTFTSENPIELPTATSARRAVIDSLGGRVEPRRSYRMASSLGGALGGQVYLDTSPNSAAPCPDGVFKYNSDGGPRGTPVRFIPHTSQGNPPAIYENQDINIQFTTRSCVDYTVWKVGEYNATLEARLLETSGGTIGQRDSSWFKIMRAERGYHLMYCPGPFVCPSCDFDGCQPVWVIMQDGRRRLALARRQTPPQQIRFPLSVFLGRT